MAKLVTNGSMDETGDMLEKSEPSWKVVNLVDFESQNSLHLAITSVYFNCKLRRIIRLMNCGCKQFISESHNQIVGIVLTRSGSTNFLTKIPEIE